MSSKRAGRPLADVMGELDDEPPPASAIAAVPPSVGAGQGTAPTIVPVNVLITPGDRRRLRQLSLDSGLSLQKLGHEAWNRLLEARGLESLEPVAANVPSGRSRR